jgi:hypothetical protein
MAFIHDSIRSYNITDIPKIPLWDSNNNVD